MPTLHIHDKHWHAGLPQLQAITDSKFLADSLNARAQFKAERDFDLVYSVVDEIETLWRQGWYPRQLVEDFVEWRGRKWNTLADFAANVAASHQAPLSLVRDDIERYLSSENKLIQAHSDGSLYKESGRGAYGYSIVALERQNHVIARTILAGVAEPLINQPISTAECLGLFNAIKHINRERAKHTTQCLLCK